MPTTLTTTGPVNLTSPTNWSPSQIPAPGDDLIIAGHTLTADIDFTANTITFNNAASRLDWSALPRTITATNGWFITGNLGTNALTVQTLTTGTLTLYGRWTVSAGTGNSGRIASVAGGTLNLITASGSSSDILYQVTGNTLHTLPTLSAGQLNTTGRILFETTNTAYLAVNFFTGGKWTHTSSGSNTFASGAQRFELSGSASIDFTGRCEILGGSFPWRFNTGHSGTVRFYGDLIANGQTQDRVFIMNSTGSTLIFLGGIETNTQVTNGGTGNTIWQNATATIAAGQLLRFNQTVSLLSNITINNGGTLAFFAGIASVGDPCVITATNANAQVYVPSSVLNGKILPFQTAAPVLPAVQNVAAGTVYGYAGFNQTGTGLIMDPAVLSSAISSANIPQTVWRRLRSADADQAGTYGKVTEWAGAVDLTPVTEQLDDIETTLATIQDKTDTIAPVDLTPISNQLDDIQAKTDTIEPVDLTPISNQLDDIQAKTDTIEPVDLTPISNQLDDIQAKTDTIEPPASGPHRLTITALDAGDQVAGVIVRIVGVAGTLRTTTTDAAEIIDLDPGDYSLRVSVPNGFAPIADIPVNNLDADRTITITLTRTTIAPPAAGNLCAVALRVATASDTPLAAASVTAYLVTGPAIGDTLHNGPTEITTNANGLATLQLLRGQTYDLAVIATVGGVTGTVTVRRVIPNASTANFGTLVAG